MSKNKTKAAPSWIADVAQMPSKWRPQWEKWPPEARALLDDLIRHMRATGSYWTPTDVAERLTRELAERGVLAKHGKPVIVTRNMITAYCPKVHGFNWSSMRP